MALDWQALAAKKAWKAFETCEALEQVAARMKRVMGLTLKVRGAEPACRRSVPLDRSVSHMFHRQTKLARSLLLEPGTNSNHFVGYSLIADDDCSL